MRLVSDSVLKLGDEGKCGLEAIQWIAFGLGEPGVPGGAQDLTPVAGDEHADLVEGGLIRGRGEPGEVVHEGGAIGRKLPGEGLLHNRGAIVQQLKQIQQSAVFSPCRGFLGRRLGETRPGAIVHSRKVQTQTGGARRGRASVAVAGDGGADAAQVAGAEEAHVDEEGIEIVQVAPDLEEAGGDGANGVVGLEGGAEGAE